MNIGYFGDGVWAYKNLLKIIKDSSINLKFICLRYKKPDKKIKKISKKINIPCFNFKNINSNKSLKKILKFDPIEERTMTLQLPLKKPLKHPEVFPS